MRRARLYSSSSYWIKIQYTALRFFDRRNSLPSVGIPEWDERRAARLLKQTRRARRSRGWTHCGEGHECQPPCHKLWKPFFWYRLLVEPGGPRMSQPKKSANPKVTIIASKGANQAINYLLEDRDELEWLVAIGRNHKGDIFFYDTGGDIIQDLGALEYIKERILRDYFGETDE